MVPRKTPPSLLIVYVLRVPHPERSEGWDHQTCAFQVRGYPTFAPRCWAITWGDGLHAIYETLQGCIWVARPGFDRAGALALISTEPPVWAPGWEHILY